MAIRQGAHLRFSPIAENNSDGWQIGLRYRYASRFARFSHQQMTNMFFSGICDAENGYDSCHYVERTDIMRRSRNPNIFY